jgi:pimeloyl-ACP methyl ester carboxylesterase
MAGPGSDASGVLPDGRVLEYWEGGDPDGRGVVCHSGTPCTRVFGTLSDEVARDLGVRLVMVNRPGYGGSSLPPGPPSLLATGRDTAALAGLLRMTEYAVLGTSGGGPFAVATAVADPQRVRGVAVVAGIGPWRLLSDPADEPEELAQERALLALLDAGDVAGAWSGMVASVHREVDKLAGLDDEARLDTFFGGSGNAPTAAHDRAAWAANLADLVAHPEGWAFDSLAWGGSWDVDPSEVAAPTALWYGDADFMSPPTNGQWYADRIAGSELVVLPGENHMQVCSDHWTEHLTGLLDRWGSTAGALAPVSRPPTR